MILVLGTYVKTFERTDEVFTAHREFMHSLVESGQVLCSGPRAGGSVILAYGDDAEAVLAALADDPFALGGYATFEAQAFTAGLVDPRITPGLVS